MQRLHQLVSNECMSILEMGTKLVHDNYKHGSARSYRLMMLNNLICFNEILSGNENFITDDDSDTIFKISVLKYHHINRIRQQTGTSGQCNIYSYI